MDNYSVLDKVFHRLVLGADFLGEALYDLEAKQYGKKVRRGVRPVFVSGLARAGTTVLMRALYETEAFASLTYRDMPGVMAPNFWGAISSKAQKIGRSQERAHGDGVVVSFDSPEALDEVFWRIFCGDAYIGKSTLRPHSIPIDVMEKFKNYMGLVCLKYGKDRYLSKNNNNILRLNALSSALPGATFLIPFRDPMAQAKSLRTQHKRFSTGSAFEQSYMTWLGHHEFGVTHKPFHFECGWEPQGTPDSLEYWLGVWCHVYDNVAQIITEGPDNLIPVGYEALCQNDDVWDGIRQKIGVAEAGSVDFTVRNDAPPEVNNTALMEKARAIYAVLDALSQKRLNANVEVEG